MQTARRSELDSSTRGGADAGIILQKQGYILCPTPAKRAVALPVQFPGWMMYNPSMSANTNDTDAIDDRADGADDAVTRKQVIYTETGHGVARITPSHGNGSLTPYSSERARVASARRWSLARQHAAAEVTRRVLGVAEAGDAAIIAAAPVKQQWAAAYGVLAGVQAERAYMDADAQSFRNVRHALGVDTGAPERTTSVPGAPAVDDADAADLRAVLAAYRAWRDAHPDEAAQLVADGD